MSKSTHGLRKAGLATLATTLVMGAGIAGAGSASAVADFKFQRIGGADRYETSALVAEEFAATHVDVILANGEPGNYADALSANTLAGEKNAPVLLTRKDKTPPSVLQQLKDNGAKNIWVVGGESVVSAAQVQALKNAGYTVERVAGSDRFETNADVIGMSGAAKGGTGLIATGFNFPDALAAGPISFQGHPLGLSTNDSIDDSVVNALKAAGVTKVLIFGGTGAVGPGVEAKLVANGITVTKRFAGEDRSDTSEQAAEYAIANLGFTNKHLGVASGYVQGFGADALAGGPLEGKEIAPMLVTRDVNNPDDVVDYMKAHANTLETGHIYGGTGAISTNAQAAMEAAAKSVTSNQDYTATSGGDDATIEEGEVRQFSFSGITADEVDIVLAHCDDVTTDENGVTTFRDDEPTEAGDNDADFGGVNGATITVVNGVNSDGQDVSPVNGNVSFTVESNGQTCFVPVVFADEADDSELDLDANNQPTDDFGIGGDTTVVPAESETTVLTADEDINSVDKAADQFITDRALYNYDANDRFYIERTNDDSNNTPDAVEEVTLAEFEAQLSEGDELSQGSTYQANEALSSQFLLEDISPEAPTAGDASDTTDTTTTLTFTDVSEDASQVTVYCEVQDTGVLAPDANVTMDSDVCATATEDADADTDGFQVVVTGLEPGTTYDFAGTQTVDGEESAQSEEIDDVETRDEPVDRPTIENAEITIDEVVEGLATDGDQYELTFSEDVNFLNTDGLDAGSRFSLTDVDGDKIIVECGAAADDETDPETGDPVAQDGITAALCETRDSDTDPTNGTDNVLVIELVENAEDRNAAGDGAIEYPLTITAVTGVTDNDGDDATVDLANSEDVVIDDEGNVGEGTPILT